MILAQELIARIKAGEFRIGDRLPTELDLCESRSLTRGTVRQALAFVTGRAEMLAFVQRRRIRDPASDVVAADADLAGCLGVPVDGEWYRVSGACELHGSSDAPVCWSELYLKAEPPHRRMSSHPRSLMHSVPKVAVQH